MERARVDVAYVLILDATEEKVLMVENRNGNWSLPGGAREAGETLDQAAIREAKEETGFDVAVGGIVHVSEKFFGSDHVLFVTFRGEILGGNPQTDDSEIGAIEWKMFAEAERLMPFYEDIRGMSNRMAPYLVES
ncbi:MAG: NUDIX hydrolase [Thermomicrobiales bacterium]